MSFCAVSVCCVTHVLCERWLPHVVCAVKCVLCSARVVWEVVTSCRFV